MICEQFQNFISDIIVIESPLMCLQSGAELER